MPLDSGERRLESRQRLHFRFLPLMRITGDRATLQSSTAICLRYSLFWDVTRLWLAVLYRRFGTTIFPISKGWEVQQEILQGLFFPLEDCTDTFYRNVDTYQLATVNIPEDYMNIVKQAPSKHNFYYNVVNNSLMATGFGHTTIFRPHTKNTASYCTRKCMPTFPSHQLYQL